jgi:hypothetical protein
MGMGSNVPAARRSRVFHFETSGTHRIFPFFIGKGKKEV